MAGDLDRLVDQLDGSHADWTAGPVGQLDAVRQQLVDAEAENRVRLPSTDLHQGPGPGRDAVDGLRVRPRCRGVAGFDPTQIALRIAAIRETFEECGVLLAGPLGEDRLIDAQALARVEARYRSRLQSGQLAMGDIVETEALELACDRLVPFAHWITPEMMPKRFDTHFFLARAPADQLALHDGQEAVDSLWTTPASAVAEAESGRRTIVFPTLLNLRKLGRSGRVDEALEAARADHIVTVLPKLLRDEDGQPILQIPEEAGYDITEAPVPGLR